jgi:hypothetical protein
MQVTMYACTYMYKLDKQRRYIGFYLRKLIDSKVAILFSWLDDITQLFLPKFSIFCKF